MNHLLSLFCEMAIELDVGKLGSLWAQFQVKSNSAIDTHPMSFERLLINE